MRSGRKSGAVMARSGSSLLQSMVALIPVGNPLPSSDVARLHPLPMNSDGKIKDLFFRGGL